jgi:hypothetical protein
LAYALWLLNAAEIRQAFPRSSKRLRPEKEEEDAPRCPFDRRDRVLRASCFARIGERQADTRAGARLGNTATFRAGRVCDFRLHLEPVVNNEYSLTFPAEANGDVRQIVDGHLVTRFTNLDTGKSIDLNTSAKATLVFHEDGFTSIETSGPQVIIILAIGGRVPAAYVLYGHGVFTQFPNGFLDIVSQTGTQFDICAALSP